MAHLPTDTVLAGRFRIVGELGSGGMATVYLAVDLASDERVALKLLHPHLVADPSARRRLQRELAAAEALDHPGMLLAREAVELDGQVGLVLPLHPGRTLAEVVAMDGPLDTDGLRRLGTRLAEALEAAHRAGVLHRDVTPRNVLVDDRGAPVLTDFGLARLADGGTRRSTQLVGTTGFLAPEVLHGGRADPQADLYGLGGVLYQAATGRPPFSGDSPAAVMQAQLSGPPRPPRELAPDLPAWLDTLILRLLDPDPTRRPPGAAAVIDALATQQAPTSPAETRAVAVTPRLPGGDWTVVVRESEDHMGQRDFRRAVRRRARHAGRHAERHAERVGGIDVGRIVDEASRAIEQIAGWDDDRTSLEGRLATAVAEQAGLPPDALQPTAPLEGRHFHLVRGIDRDTAEALAQQVRMLGLRARVRREGADDSSTWLRRHWWALIPLMWILFPALMAVGAPSWTVFAFVAATVLLSTTIGPWLVRDLLSAKDDQAPVAYRQDLGPALAEGYRAVEGGREATGEEGKAQHAQPAEARTRAQAVAAEALAGIAALEEAIAARHESLAEPVAVDLRSSARSLRREVEGLVEDTTRVEAELAAPAAPDAGAWAAERLGRLRTLAAAGQPVDAHELERLQAAADAADAAWQAEAALDRRLTADLARLLEIAATARRLAREVALEHDEPRRAEEALAELEERARAAAAARRELAGS
ncbi:MAG: serine/threonine protein kinase [Alphaproteobacteria bacterium]|nr:serine/threonine protein kinase [Alphaproteobacteria bacterium]